MIAHHFLRAAETGRALPHLHEAGKRAIENCAYNEAIAHLQTGLDLQRAAAALLRAASQAEAAAAQTPAARLRRAGRPRH